MKKQFFPLNDMVLVEMAEAESKTAGGIILPDEAKRKPDEGIVKRVGTEVKEIKPGDHVVFGKYVGIIMNLKEDSKEFMLLHETDILGRYF